MLKDFAVSLCLQQQLQKQNKKTSVYSHTSQDQNVIL